MKLRERDKSKMLNKTWNKKIMRKWEEKYGGIVDYKKREKENWQKIKKDKGEIKWKRENKIEVKFTRKGKIKEKYEIIGIYKS